MQQAVRHFHVVFGTLAQETLTEAMRGVGRNDAVLAFPDDLSIGPINGVDAEARMAAIVRDIGPTFVSRSDLLTKMDAFWRAFRSEGAVPVIWFTRRSAREFSGFLELATVLKSQPFLAMDFTGADVVTRLHIGPGKLKIYLSLGEMRPSEVAVYIGAEEVVPSAQLEGYRELWERLKQENAPLRLLTDGGLASAPASFFDVALLEATPSNWQTIAVTIGEVWDRSWEDHVFQIDEIVLAERVRSLVRQGLLDCRGDIDDLRTAEIRRT